MRSYKHQLDKNGKCRDQGEVGEAHFCNAMTLAGYTSEKITKNLKDHIDFYVYGKDGAFPFQVKSIKNNEQNGYSNPDWIWIELVGKVWNTTLQRITDINRGWLFAGRWQFIAFEHLREFLVFERTALQRYVRGLKFDKIVGKEMRGKIHGTRYVYNRMVENPHPFIPKEGDHTVVLHVDELIQNVPLFSRLPKVEGDCY